MYHDKKLSFPELSAFIVPSNDNLALTSLPALLQYRRRHYPGAVTLQTKHRPEDPTKYDTMRHRE